MSADYEKLNFLSLETSLKLWREDSGSGTIPATALPASPPKFSRITIPHGFGSDELVFRVLVVIPSASPPFNNYFVIPYAGGGTYATASVDSTNLYIEVGNTSSGSAALNFNYYYRILIP